jgi:hypothetical protein
VLGGRSLAVSVSAVFAAGCAEPLSLLERGPASPSQYIFWPPPGATSIWVTGPLEAATGTTLGEAEVRVSRALHAAGYTDARRYPIGMGYVHGFALATRLEAVDDAGAPEPAGERWSALYPEASNLLWLRDARRPPLPGAGRYRVLLVAYTDLPACHVPHRAPTWDERNVMEGPDVNRRELPVTPRASPDYRVAVFVYEYASVSPDGDGELLANAELSAAKHLEATGLSSLRDLWREARTHRP